MFDPFETAWAGYGPDGNDQSFHLHVHPNGDYIRSDGVRGFRCVALLKLVGGNYRCTDPSSPILSLAIRKEVN